MSINSCDYCYIMCLMLHCGTCSLTHTHRSVSDRSRVRCPPVRLPVLSNVNHTAIIGMQRRYIISNSWMNQPAINWAYHQANENQPQWDTIVLSVTKNVSCHNGWKLVYRQLRRRGVWTQLWTGTSLWRCLPCGFVVNPGFTTVIHA